MLDRNPRFPDPFSPIEGASAGSRESPSIDVTVPSPTLDQSLISHHSKDTQHGHPTKNVSNRTSDEQSRSRPFGLGDIPRPMTSDAVDTRNSLGTIYQAQSNDPTFRPSPNPMYPRSAEHGDRYSPEPNAKYGEASSPNLRTYNASPQLSERGFGEEYGQGRGIPAKKSRLNLLNPMSLLARRRSSQAQNEASNLSINTMHVPALPDNFDPSIRGTITHDFSAPRSRRNPSFGDITSPESARREAIQSSPVQRPDAVLTKQKAASSHSPMFREHFQDDRQALRPEQTRYLHNLAAQASNNTAREATTMPAFAKRLPMRLPDQAHPPLIGKGADAEDDERPLPDLPQKSPPAPPPQPKDPPPLPPLQRTPSPKINIPTSLLPKHMTSTSSRFSFQLVGQASSAQEKLLEEKHKETQADKRISKLSRRRDAEDDDYDDYDPDADDLYEEQIPGVNADYHHGMEDDGFSHEEMPAYDRSKVENLTSLHSQPYHGLHFTPQSSISTPAGTTHGSQPTPRDHDGLAIGVADSADSVDHQQPQIMQQYGQASVAPMSLTNGLGIITSDLPPPAASAPTQRIEAFDDDELYFDDGEFADELQEAAYDDFDESVLDDETIVRDIPAENLRKFEAAQAAAGDDDKIRIIAPGTSDGLRKVDGQMFNYPGPESDPPETITGLTEDNLAAYHDALATAANEAAANGRFDRNVTFANNSEDEASQSQNGVISDESRISHHFRSPSIAEDDGFPFDDDMDDELLIAEANAEALENDDDGFYGQEFGFYARARGKETVEMVNGGFFGARGSNGIKRSHSGKANFQEPSLTPITERSEWSTRNSVASIPIHSGIPGSAHSLSSPGIAQLLELDSPAQDEDMTLQALLKLRKGAFGGSQTSINSLGQSQHNPGSSPLAQASHHPFGPQDHGHSRMGTSLHSLTAANLGIPESEEEFDEDLTTITHNTPMKKMSSSSETPVTPSEQSMMSPGSGFDVSPERKSSSQKRRSMHSRTSSGAESVSYARDTDGRWVLERRRTGEDGGVEVDREYLAGARI